MLRSYPRALLLPIILAACGDSQPPNPVDAGADVPARVDAAADAPGADVPSAPDTPSPVDAPAADVPGLEVAVPLDAPAADADEDRPAPNDLDALDAPADSASPADQVTIPIDAPPVDVRLEAAVDAPICPSGQTRCGATCVDTRVSMAHCGRCDNACPVGGANTVGLCREGACAVTCAAGFENCDTDPANGCETPTGFARTCDGACVDVRVSVNHCGACGAACRITATNGHAMARCADRRCELACEPGYADCDGTFANGCEADLSGTVHCGRCGGFCPELPGASAVCRAGACGTTCQANRGDCDGDAANGCEANLASSVTNCGGCGVVCPMTTGATPTCRDGVCVRDQCSAGYANCNANPADGCEAHLATDRLNCGTCGTTCATPLGFANGSMTCRAGACDAQCATGWGNCDANLMNGCETDLQSTRTHCGACGRVCPGGCLRGVCL